MSDLTIEDYEEVLQSHRRLVRELDVLLNGEEGAAKQASLCDLVGQVKGVVAKRGGASLLASSWPGLVELDKLTLNIDTVMTGEIPDKDGKQLILNNLHNMKAIMADFNNLANLEGQYIKTMGSLVEETIELVKELQVAIVNISADTNPK